MSDSDDPGMCRVFAVEKLKGDDREFDLDIPPTSGLEYLRRVQKEAKHCPAVVVADIDARLLDHHGHPINSHVKSSGMQPAPVGFAPSQQWQKEQAANFSDIRQKLARYKSKMTKEDQWKAKKLPPKENVEDWCKLCFGHVIVHHSDKSVPARDNLGLESSEQTFCSGGTPPLLTVVAHMDQPTVLQVLEYHCNWFEATGFSKEQGQWFYALMSCLEKPLVPEACSLLRDLARNCANLRATLDNAHDPKLIPLNLLICLVARYFEQTDLADKG